MVYIRNAGSTAALKSGGTAALQASITAALQASVTAALQASNSGGPFILVEFRRRSTLHLIVLCLNDEAYSDYPELNELLFQSCNLNWVTV